MFEEYGERPECTVDRVDPSTRDDDVRTVIDPCEHHATEVSVNE